MCLHEEIFLFLNAVCLTWFKTVSAAPLGIFTALLKVGLAVELNFVLFPKAYCSWVKKNKTGFRKYMDIL